MTDKGKTTLDPRPYIHSHPDCDMHGARFATKMYVGDVFRPRPEYSPDAVGSAMDK